MHGGLIRIYRQIAVILGLATLVALPAHARGRIDCDDRVNQVLGDLNKLRTENEKVRQLCEGNLSEKINTDTAYGRYPGGDCEQTYGVINGLGDRVEDKLELACHDFKEATQCQSSTQRQNFNCGRTAFQRAGTRLREATALLRNARRILKKRVDHNEVDLNEYARLGNFSPASVLGAPPGNLSPDGMRYFRLAREQAQSMQQGMEFIHKARPVEDKLNQYQARLNAMGATTGQRQQQLAQQTASTITGSTKAAQLAQAGGDLFGQQAGGAAAAGGAQAASSAPRGYREQDFLMREGEGEVSDEQFFGALEGKPLGVDLAAKMPDDAKGLAADESTKVGVNATAGTGSGAEHDLSSQLAGASQLDNGAAKLSAADFAAAPRNLASTGRAGAGGLNVTGASAPGFGGKAGGGEKSSGDEALANYESSNGTPRLIDRGGPSLRDMLKQRMSAGGASTRAMHEVLGGMQELTGEEGAQANQAAGQHDENEQQGDAPEIKGMDSEPLFVRVRAAHLRYQKVYVSDVSF